MRARTGRRAAAGLSLIELVAAIAVLALAGSVALGAILSALPQHVEAGNPVRGRELARDLLEEILSKPVTDPDGVGGEPDRAAFDDVTDYASYSRPAEGIDGTPIPGAAGFRRAARVIPVDPTADPPLDLGASALATASLVRIEVDASWSEGKVTLVGMKARTESVAPAPRAALVYIDQTRSNGNGEHVTFDLRNRTGRAVTVDRAQVYWDPADTFYFGRFELGSFLVTDRSPRFTRGQTITLDPPVTFDPEIPVHTEVKDCKVTQSGGGASAHMRDYTIRLVLSNSVTGYQVDIYPE